jgi:uncharacterized membrane protein
MRRSSMQMTAGASIWMAIWMAVLVAIVWFLVIGDRQEERENPAEILRRRFAAGDISEDEFRHARDVLGTGEAR